MTLRIRNQKDFAAGAIYVLAGAAFSIGALNYKLGDPARMGPGFFPFWIGILLVLVGVATALSSVRRGAPAEAIQRPELRAMAWIIGAVVLFGLLLQPLGLVLALVVLVLVSSRASHEFRWKGALVNTVVLILFSTGAFIWGIKLQFALWPAFSELRATPWNCSTTSRSASSTACHLQNLLYAFIGCLLGTLIGVLPGIGPVATIAMLLPITFALPPVVGADHARRHLLRRAVRRLDHGDPGQPAGRIVLGRHLPSTATRWRARAAPAPALAIAAHRLVLRRLRRDAA